MLRSPAGVTSLIDLNNPVICALGRVFGGVLPGRRARVPGLAVDEDDKRPYGIVRTDIVDEKLCDDIVQYLSPTLEAHQGCTIIDMNPGACLWSRKLHELLNPKRHILMEPEERYHDTFLNPLLKQPGSKYVVTKLPGTGPNKYRTAFEELVQKDLLPPWPEPSRGNSPLRQMNNKLLITGNLARRHYEGPSYSGAAASPNYVLQQMIWAALTNDLYQRGGLVRMLWWMPERFRMYSVPERAAYCAVTNINVQLGANATEVVGVTTNAHYRSTTTPSSRRLNSRPAELEAESGRAVHRRMQRTGTAIPNGRSVRSVIAKEALLESGLKSPLDIDIVSMTNMREAFQVCNAYVVAVCDALADLYPERKRASLQGFLKGLEYPQSVLLARGLDKLDTTKTSSRSPLRLSPGQVRAALLIDAFLRIVNLEAQCKTLQDEGHGVHELELQILALDRKVRDSCVGSLKAVLSLVEPLVMEQIALFSAPPSLTLDRRSYEPLQAKVEDFWPRNELTLLDIMPHQRDMSVSGIADSVESVRTAQELITSLFHYQVQPLPWVLDKMAPNAAQDLIPKVPSLTDPRKGGRLNVEALQIRNLTDEMIEGLTKAWLEWPFKPERAQLALEHASEGRGEGGTDVEELGEHDMD